MGLARAPFRRGPYLESTRHEAERLVQERKAGRLSTDAVTGTLMCGGFNGITELSFVKGFGHNPETFLGTKYNYGFVPVALFLGKVMTTHVDILFRSYDLCGKFGHRNGGYITDSQSDF